MTLAATGLASGSKASPELAQQAVLQALAGLNGQTPAAVLLFLSPDFANDPKPAILAACRAAACTQLAGCTAAGILTQQDWILDAPAAAALALAAPLGLSSVQQAGQEQPRLCLAAPNAINTNWLHAPGQRFGGIAGDATGQGAYKIWASGRLQADGLTQLQLSGVATRVLVAQGLKPLSEPANISAVNDLDVLAINGSAAPESLAIALATQPHEIAEQDVRLGVLCESATATADDSHYYPLALLQQNWRTGSVTVTQKLTTDQPVFWAQREAGHAATLIRQQLIDYAARHGQPDFVLMFSCAGRGPQFYDGVDRDWQAIRDVFPHAPLLGMYGNGQFAPLVSGNHLLDGSTVLALCHGSNHV